MERLEEWDCRNGRAPPVSWFLALAFQLWTALCMLVSRALDDRRPSVPPGAGVIIATRETVARILEPVGDQPRIASHGDPSGRLGEADSWELPAAPGVGEAFSEHRDPLLSKNSVGSSCCMVRSEGALRAGAGGHMLVLRESEVVLQYFLSKVFSMGRSYRWAGSLHAGGSVLEPARPASLSGTLAWDFASGGLVGQAGKLVNCSGSKMRTRCPPATMCTHSRSFL